VDATLSSLSTLDMAAVRRSRKLCDEEVLGAANVS
jgi:hypothetical protein